MDPIAVEVIEPSAAHAPATAPVIAPVKNAEPPGAAAGDRPEGALDHHPERVCQQPSGNDVRAPSDPKSKSNSVEQRSKSYKRSTDAENDKKNAADEPLVLDSVEDDPDEQNANADVEDPNWRWPAYDEVENQFKHRVFVKRSNAIPRDMDDGSPFQVIYRKANNLFWSDVVRIKLNSIHLIKILSEYLPNNARLRNLENLDVGGKELYVILDELKMHQLSDGNDSTITTTGMLAENVSVNDSCFTMHQNGKVGEVPNGIIEPAQGSHQSGDSASTENSEMGSKDTTTKGATLESVSKGRLHLNHLLRFMEEEYSDVMRRNQRMREEKTVSWDMLWAFLPPDKKVVYTCSHTQELLCAKVSTCEYQHAPAESVFSIKLNVWDYNGTAYHKCKVFRGIPFFGGEGFFDALGVWPIDLDRKLSPEDFEAEFTAKGRAFQELAIQNRNCFKHYRGPIFQVKDGELIKEKADGRVMIDLCSFAKMNPSYFMMNAQPPDVLLALTYGRANAADGGPVTFVGDLCPPRPPPPKPKPPPPPKEPPPKQGQAVTGSRLRMITKLANPLDDAADAAVRIGQIADEKLRFAPAIVYGFSFTLNDWGAFAVSGFSDISFDEGAFDMLMMESDLKGLLYNLVSPYMFSSIDDGRRVDPIANKGKGCIFLCYGPPGTGKTFTAMSMAEKMQRPLLTINMSQFVTPTEVEENLVAALDIAAMWRAVLLVDEADGFLERRSDCGNIIRNAMTGHFSRLLKSYPGVVFLTTNRVTTFDDAFRSRVSLFLSYPQLSEEQRVQIWKASLTRVQLGDAKTVTVSAKFLADMGRQELNGHEIRNAIHTAQILASNAGEKLQEKHLRLVTRVICRSLDSVNNADLFRFNGENYIQKLYM